MQPDDGSRDHEPATGGWDRGSSTRRARTRAVLVTMTMLAVLTLIVIGVVRIVQS
jgi:hypothetical protein